MGKFSDIPLEELKQIIHQEGSARGAARIYGVHHTTVLERLWKAGLSIDDLVENGAAEGQKKISPEEIVVHNLNIPVYQEIDHDGGEEEIQVLHMGDEHAGKITVSYNKDVFRERMEAVFYRTIKLAKLHRKMYPIRKLHIVDTGDRVQGENPHQGSKIGEVECGARDQVKKIAFPVWAEMIAGFKQYYDEVEVDFIPGNHGAEHLAPETSSWDIALADILQAHLGREKGIKINAHEHFGTIIDINGFRFFAFHGDGIPTANGVPFFAMDRKLKAWFIQYGGFQYAVSGHFHHKFNREVASQLQHWSCSTLVSDDEWAIKKMGVSSTPSQRTFGVHPRYGVTWNYTIIVDTKFLPKSANNQEEKGEKAVMSGSGTQVE